MIRALRKHWLFALEVTVAATYFAVTVRPEADWGGGTIPVIALLLAATSIALHRVRPSIALAALVVQVLMLLTLC